MPFPPDWPRILRVFPRRTSYTPTDDLVAIGDPGLFRPEADVVYVSCTFTWDIEEAERLAAAWGQYYPVRLGGPAIRGAYSPTFPPGRFVRTGVTFTSRGCPGNCPWCLVPEREGKLVELDEIAPGYVIQDNNFLATSTNHRQRVYRMLAEQRRGAEFRGGLEAARITDEVADELRGLRIREAWLAADTAGALKPLRQAVKRLSFLGLRSNRLRCYVMIGRGEAVEQAEARLESVWGIGAMPFAQLYQPPEHERLCYSTEWRALERKWARPAAIRASHKEREER